MGGGGGSAPSADPNVGIAALKQAQLGEDWLSIAKDQFAAENVRNDEMASLAKEVSAQQLDASKQAQTWATEDRDRYKTVFQPLQDEFIDTAKNWDSADRQSQLASEAKADVLNNAGQQAAARERTMASMGINPTSGRYAGVERAADTTTALAAAGAENNARATARKEAVSLKADAVNMGNGLPTSAATSLGLGVSAGSTAVSTTAGANAAYGQSLGVLQSGYSTAMNGYSSQANILQNQYNSQLQAWQANQANQSSLFGGLMGAAGTIGGAAIMASSKDYKEDKVPVKGVLDAVRKMPVEEWSYKDGIADGGRHIGPYAEDFQAATGKGDGKVIPIVDAIGVTLGALKELDRKVARIAQRSGERGITRKAA
jgi:hypothetical protein